MRRLYRGLLFGLVIIWSCWLIPVKAQSPADVAVRVSAVVQTSPPRIQLVWPADSRDVIYYVFRKQRDAVTWGDPVELGLNAGTHVDTDVSAGQTYEYWLSKWTASGYFGGEGYIYVGIEAPLTESRGKVVLIVEAPHASSLATELARFEQDLAGDGWTVLRHDVPRMSVDPANTSSDVWAARSNELASVKALIKADYDADPVNVKAVVLFGRVPVPYSGDLYPDYHTDHRGAWPADGYYGDMDGAWTDSTVNRTSASDPRNRNAPGDGKFDATIWPSNASNQRGLELQVGRVDFANLPAYPESEVELLRRYLDKAHRFRHKVFTPDRRGLVDDNLGYFTGEAPAMNGWRDFAAFFGASNVVAADWLTVPSSQIYLWGYGCGAGTYTSCSGVATTAQLGSGDPRIVFTMLFGSYFGDWDSPNNLLRAAIATTNYTLTSAWVCRPYWHFHHMGLGETIGFSTRLSQNNDGSLYSANGFPRMVHIALMGDPTLRMHVVGPPSGLAAQSDPGGVKLTWNPSTDTVLGYHVYRSTNAAGPFTRLNGSLITDTNYIDFEVGTNVYMVRAVKLEVSGSGSYYNASQGIFQSFTPVHLPVLTISAQSTNKVYGAPLPELIAIYSGFVGEDGPEGLTPPPVLETTATAASPVGNYSITPSGAGSANYSIQYEAGTLSVTPAALTIKAQNTNKLYGAVLPVFTPLYDGLVNDDMAADLDSPPVLSTSATVESPVGNYPITAGGAADLNYNITFNEGTLAVDPSPLTVTADNQSRAYGQADPVFTLSYDGFVNEDDAGDLDSLPTASTTATSASPPGDYVIAVTGGEAQDYALHRVNGTLTITNPPVPAITGVELTNGWAVITWKAMAGLNYRLQYKGELADASWLDETPDVPATGPTASGTNVVGDATHRFYRVLLVPPDPD
ncbi:MAG: hypothetical protein IH623_26885 [Verrucomicrobia bacterium]|nr:hypothetical protein [Verrucomicrobiota bacterium]